MRAQTHRVYIYNFLHIICQYSITVLNLINQVIQTFYTLFKLTVVDVPTHAMATQSWLTRHTSVDGSMGGCTPFSSPRQSCRHCHLAAGWRSGFHRSRLPLADGGGQGWLVVAPAQPPTSLAVIFFVAACVLRVAALGATAAAVGATAGAVAVEAATVALGASAAVEAAAAVLRLAAALR